MRDTRRVDGQIKRWGRCLWQSNAIRCPLALRVSLQAADSTHAKPFRATQTSLRLPPLVLSPSPQFALHLRHEPDFGSLRFQFSLCDSPRLSRPHNMGVPFEALLPYGIILGVRLIRQSPLELLLTSTTDVRPVRIWYLFRKGLCQRRQEGPLEPGSLGSGKSRLECRLRSELTETHGLTLSQQSK